MPVSIKRLQSILTRLTMCKFLDELVEGRVEGGQIAVGRLKQAVLERLRSSDPNLPHHLKVVVRVYANLRGLAKAYVDTEVLKDRDDLDQFVRGFNMGDQLCDFVDAGNGKECADEKVKGNPHLDRPRKSMQSVVLNIPRLLSTRVG